MSARGPLFALSGQPSQTAKSRENTRQQAQS